MPADNGKKMIVGTYRPEEIDRHIRRVSKETILEAGSYELHELYRYHVNMVKKFLEESGEGLVLNSMMEYKGYRVKFEYDDKGNILAGTMIGLKDMIGFHGTLIKELACIHRAASERQQIYRKSIDQFSMGYYFTEYTFIKHPSWSHITKRDESIKWSIDSCAIKVKLVICGIYIIILADTAVVNMNDHRIVKIFMLPRF